MEHEYQETFYGDTGSMENASTIHLVNGESHDIVDIWLSEMPAVAGTVLDSAGARRSDVRVTAYRRTAMGWEDAGGDYTDVDGRYRVLVGSAGVYTVKFADCAGTLDPSDDSFLYLGGATTPDEAATMTVQAHAASVPAPFSLPVAPLPAAKRVSDSSDAASAIAASREAFPTADEPDALRSLRPAGYAASTNVADTSDALAPTVVLTAIDRYPEALCAAGLAGAVRGPVLLTSRKALYPGVIAEMKRLGTKSVLVVGDRKAVPELHLRLLRALGFAVERISGTDRYGLSANVARKIAAVSEVTSATPVFVTGGYNTADGYMVAPAAYASHGILLLTGKTSTPKSVASVVKSLGLKIGYAVGDKKHLPSSSLSGLSKAGMAVTRGATSTSTYSRAASFATAAIARGWLSSEKVGVVCLSSLSQSLGAPAALGALRAPLVFVATNAVPSATSGLLATRSQVIDQTKVFSRQSTVKTRVFMSLGSL